jgi:hypothetical protein
MRVKFHQVLAVAVLAAAAASVYSARRAATSGSTVPAEAVAYHGAAQLYRNLAVFFGRQAFRAEAQYWKAIKG